MTEFDHDWNEPDNYDNFFSRVAFKILLWIIFGAAVLTAIGLIW